MLACKGIFAKPSISQAGVSPRRGDSPKLFSLKKVSANIISYFLCLVKYFCAKGLFGEHFSTFFQQSPGFGLKKPDAFSRLNSV